MIFLSLLRPPCSSVKPMDTLQGWLNASSEVDFGRHTKEFWNDFARDGVLLQTLDLAEYVWFFRKCHILLETHDFVTYLTFRCNSQSLWNILPSGLMQVVKTYKIQFRTLLQVFYLNPKSYFDSIHNLMNTNMGSVAICLMLQLGTK